MSKLVAKTVEEPKISPSEELEKLKNDELWLKEQIQKPDSYLRNLYSSNAPKKDVIVLWADNLEKQHDLEVELKRTTVVDSVGQISSYIKSELRGLGVHESTLSYVHMVLGYKYKNDSRINDRYRENEVCDTEYRMNSSNTIADFEQENKPILDTIIQQMDFLKDYRNKAKSSHILSLLDNKQLLEYEETNLRMRATIMLADQFIDDRQSVPLYAQLKLVMAVVGSTNNYAAGMYVSQIKLFGSNRMAEAQKFFDKASTPVLELLPEKTKELYVSTRKDLNKVTKEIIKLEKKVTKSKKNQDLMTSKQAMKIVLGVVKKVLGIFDHKTRDEALLDGFYGIQCPECGSYRVKQKESESSEWLCFCYRCEWIFEARTVTKCWNCHIPMFEELLQIVKKTATPVLGKDGADTGAREGKCPRCLKQLILPAKMFLKPVLRSR